MRKILAAAVLAATFCAGGAAQAGHVRVIVAPWRLRPIVVAPRVVWPLAAVVVAPAPAVVAPAPAPGKGFVDMAVTPYDADVWVDGEYVGRAQDYAGDPKFLKLSSGSHTITLAREGFSPQRLAVVVEPSRLLTLDVTLLPLGAASAAVATAPTASQPVAPASTDDGATYQLDLEKTGYLNLNVTPADAAVYVDDESYGMAAEYNNDKSIVLRAGTHTLHVVRPGHTSQVQKFEIETDTTQEVTVTLIKE